MQARKTKNRHNYRKPVAHFKLTDLSIFAKYPRFCKKAELLDISTNGMLIKIERKDLTGKLKKNFEISDIEGRYMSLKIDSMNLDMDALVIRTKSLDKDSFEIALDYSDSAPEYWREILFDMLPTEEEL